ncbi:TPA: ABC transporter [Candidatus Acetothermia bacterium]|nr:ABC transporter [Candidatus Acetothermia bacterium]
MGLEIFEFAFMQRAFLAGLIVAVICPSIGLFLVVRRYALLGEGLGHIAFGGVSLGFLAGIDPVLGAFGLTGISAIAIERLRRQGRLGGDTAIGVLIALGLAAGVVASSLAGAFNARLLGFLFGSIALVAPRDLYLIAAVGAVVMFVITAFGKELFYICFDEEAALASGLPVKFFTMLLTIMTALTVVASLRIIGVLLVFALTILPVAAAMQIAQSFRHARWLAVLFGLMAVISGLFAAFYLDLPAGGAIVLIAGALFALVSGVAAIIARSREETPGDTTPP